MIQPNMKKNSKETCFTKYDTTRHKVGNKRGLPALVVEEVSSDESIQNDSEAERGLSDDSTASSLTGESADQDCSLRGLHNEMNKDIAPEPV